VVGLVVGYRAQSIVGFSSGKAVENYAEHHRQRLGMGSAARKRLRISSYDQRTTFNTQT